MLRKLGWWCLWGWGLVWVAQGQPIGGSQTLEIEFFRPGRPTMVVYIWGAVGQPGIWRVEREVDLISLLSAARVPGVGSSPQGVSQRYLVRIFRDIGGNRQEIYQERLEHLVGGGSRPYPPLQEGDILVVEVRQRARFGWGTAFEITRTVLQVLTLYLLIRREF
ncbi:hypothetical protein [Rhodothermus bifroesti]|uniref:Soluble ligand binding domain-containing protein n=1 Tax=Rhodothermus marinus TaxID=29549 RepID=A0A7V2F6Y8_RHOMR|nr:hypothetical protein [Rhodothermus bifroesti]GBD01968.1 hypothetical protein HRbin18_01699 [bacterium HR18]